MDKISSKNQIIIFCNLDYLRKQLEKHQYKSCYLPQLLEYIALQFGKNISIKHIYLSLSENDMDKNNQFFYFDLSNCSNISLEISSTAHTNLKNILTSFYKLYERYNILIIDSCLILPNILEQIKLKINLFQMESVSRSLLSSLQQNGLTAIIPPDYNLDLSLPNNRSMVRPISFLENNYYSTEFSKEKVVLIIDGENLYYSLLDLANNGGFAVINYNKLTKLLVAGRTCLKQIYVSKVPRFQRLQMYTQISNAGYQIVTPLQQQIIKPDWDDKQVMVYLKKWVKRADTVILVSGDGHFVNILNHIYFELNKNVEVVVQNKSAHNSIKSLHRFLDLELIKDHIIVS